MVENLNARQGAGLPQPPGQGDVVDARSGVTLYGWLWKGTMAAARRVAAVRKTSRGWTRLASSVPVDTPRGGRRPCARRSRPRGSRAAPRRPARPRRGARARRAPPKPPPVRGAFVRPVSAHACFRRRAMFRRHRRRAARERGFVGPGRVTGSLARHSATPNAAAWPSVLRAHGAASPPGFVPPRPAAA